MFNSLAWRKRSELMLRLFTFLAAAASIAANATGGYSYKQIGNYSGIHFSTMWKIVRAARETKWKKLYGMLLVYTWPCVSKLGCGRNLSGELDGREWWEVRVRWL